MKKNINYENVLTGLHIYRDKRNRAIYYDVFTKNGYVIPTQMYAKYRTFSMRFLIGFLVAASLAIYLLPPVPSIILGLIAYLGMEIYFRKTFFPQLTILPNFVPEAKESYSSVLVKEKTSILCIKILLLIAFAVLLVVQLYVKETEPSAVQSAMSYIAAVLALCYALYHVFVIIKKLKK